MNVLEGVNVQKVVSGALRVDAVLRGVTCRVAMAKQVPARCAASIIQYRR